MKAEKGKNPARFPFFQFPIFPLFLSPSRLPSHLLPPPASRLQKNRPAVFLDRDGTLNRQIVRAGKPYPPATLEEFVLFPDAAAACARLKVAGFVLVVATNQPDVARGTQSREVIEAMHARLRELIPTLDRI